MDVYEQYEIMDEKFNNLFVQDLIKQTAEHGFQSVPFEKAINGISRFNIDDDIKPDIISSEVSKIFNVKSEGGKQRIIINKEQAEKFSERTRKEKGGGGGIGFLGFSFGASGSTENEDVIGQEHSSKSLDDQLKELNNYSKTT